MQWSVFVACCGPGGAGLGSNDSEARAPRLTKLVCLARDQLSENLRQRDAAPSCLGFEQREILGARCKRGTPDGHSV
jgi:hypothetical protein